MPALYGNRHTSKQIQHQVKSADQDPLYLVGVSIRANSRVGLSNKPCRIGRAKAAVLPEPVSANPITSLPTVTATQDVTDLTIDHSAAYCNGILFM